MLGPIIAIFLALADGADGADAVGEPLASASLVDVAGGLLLGRSNIAMDTVTVQ